MPTSSYSTRESCTTKAEMTAGKEDRRRWEEGGIGHETWIRAGRLEKGLCGKSRPMFFRGVDTIVTKLFNNVEPGVAFFVKKDYQQWRIIQRMVRDLDFGIEIVGSDITREKDGLAMSSRNVHLSADKRQRV